MTTALTGRQPSAAHTQIIHEVLSLYQLHPTDQSYAHYHPTATFHDPVSIAQGLESIKAQFNGMPKLFARSETRKCEVLEPAAAGRHAAREAQGVGECVVLSLTQHYVFKGAGTPEKTLESKVSLAVDGEGLVRYHEEEWDHQPNKTGEDGFMGKLQEWRKKADAKMVEAGVSSDPKKV
ncbi:glycoside hydrolase family 76 protein [Teratosphaeria destructans]|uniref:Glycoside hydrolase family 76 protein n=1 Tax=Teratosphaeria destructans TaxID=418781 RepID=A0A9W7SPL9_9PEZI|nr:glycoside hydrolase family 76 protein [Teratosphaeria destructans]